MRKPFSVLPTGDPRWGWAGGSAFTLLSQAGSDWLVPCMTHIPGLWLVQPPVTALWTWPSNSGDQSQLQEQLGSCQDLGEHNLHHPLPQHHLQYKNNTTKTNTALPKQHLQNKHNYYHTIPPSTIQNLQYHIRYRRNECSTNTPLKIHTYTLNSYWYLYQDSYRLIQRHTPIWMLLPILALFNQ